VVTSSTLKAEIDVRSALLVGVVEGSLVVGVLLKGDVPVGTVLELDAPGLGGGFVAAVAFEYY
jgi:hypothetical protein